ncbi:MAG: sulfurtransferase TusA family protein [Candidatus Caldarchaeum sp.]|nr:sulfurtransferase TusA family protein [Candidatus Caldarchaeum sp.]
MDLEPCIVPQGLLYDVDGSVWVRLVDESAVVGVTHPFLCLVGNPLKIDFRQVRYVREGGYLAVIQTKKFYGPVFSPVSGEVVEFNKSLTEMPYLLSEDPYQAGWLAKIIIQNHQPKLVDAETIKSIVSKKMKEQGLECFKHIPDYTVSGIGGDCPETLAKLGELLKNIDDREKVHLVTDNPKADTDVPSWTKAHNYKILEKQIQGSIKHFIIGKQRDGFAAGGI